MRAILPVEGPTVASEFGYVSGDRDTIVFDRSVQEDGVGDETIRTTFWDCGEIPLVQIIPVMNALDDRYRKVRYENVSEILDRPDNTMHFYDEMAFSHTKIMKMRN